MTNEYRPAYQKLFQICEAVLEQERALVGVRGPVDPRWRRPEEEGRERSGDGGGDGRLPGEQAAVGRAHGTGDYGISPRQARPYGDVGAHAVLDVRVAEHAFLHGSRPALRCAADGALAGSMRSSSRIRPSASKPQRVSSSSARERDAAAARGGHDHVADLALPRVEVELDRGGEAEQATATTVAAACVAHGESRARAVLPAALVAGDPEAHEVQVGAGGHAREAHDVLVADERRASPGRRPE